MSSVDGTFGSAPWPGRAANRLGHYGSQILIASIFAAIALRLHPLPYDSPLFLAAPVALIVVLLASWLLMRQHDRRLCEQCMSSMPLNAAQTAARYGRRFQVTHLGQRKRIVAGYLAALIGSAFLPGTVGLIIWTLMQTTMVYLVLSYSAHRRFQPWCPQCNNGGGEDQDVDTPDPVPTGHQHV
jgi:hypothetical protein